MTRARRSGRRWPVWIGRALAGLVLLGLLEFCGYALVIRMSRAVPSGVDAVLVFDGDPERVPEGLRLAILLRAPFLVVSSGRDVVIRRMVRSLRPRYRGRLVVVPGALTTDADARLTVPVVRSLVASAGGRVLLVTSWSHLPRAYLLARLYAFGSGLSFGVAGSQTAPDDWWAHRRIRLELLKVWGSLYRVVVAGLR